MDFSERKIDLPEEWEGPQCPECGEVNGDRLSRLFREPLRERWMCHACGTKFYYQTKRQREILEQLKKQMEGAKRG